MLPLHAERLAVGTGYEGLPALGSGDMACDGADPRTFAAKLDDNVSKVDSTA